MPLRAYIEAAGAIGLPLSELRTMTPGEFAAYLDGRVKAQGGAKASPPAPQEAARLFKESESRRNARAAQ